MYFTNFVTCMSYDAIMIYFYASVCYWNVGRYYIVLILYALNHVFYKILLKFCRSILYKYDIR